MTIEAEASGVVMMTASAIAFVSILASANAEPGFVTADPEGFISIDASANGEVMRKIGGAASIGVAAQATGQVTHAQGGSAKFGFTAIMSPAGQVAGAGTAGIKFSPTCDGLVTRQAGGASAVAVSSFANGQTILRVGGSAQIGLFGFLTVPPGIQFGSGIANIGIGASATGLRVVQGGGNALISISDSASGTVVLSKSFANVQTARGSTLAQCLIDMQNAATGGFHGVRVAVGIDSFGDPSNIDTSGVIAAADKAIALGLRVQWLFGYGMRNTNGDGSPAPIVTYNGGVQWLTRNRPPAGPSNAVWLQHVRLWQMLIDAIKARYDLAGLRFADWGFVEAFNEPSKGNVGGPHLASGDHVYDTIYQSYPDDAIEPAFWTYALFIVSRINTYGAPIIGTTYAGATATELSYTTGTDCAALWALAGVTIVGINIYGDVASGPAASATDWSNKVDATWTRKQGCAPIASKRGVISECGKDKTRCTDPTHPNPDRQAILRRAMTKAQPLYCAMYSYSKDNTSTSADDNFVVFDSTGAFMGGDPVGPNYP